MRIDFDNSVSQCSKYKMILRLLLTIFTLYSNIKLSHGEVTVVSTIEGLEGQPLSLTVTWTTETFILITINGPDTAYKTSCTFPDSTPNVCRPCTKLNGSPIENVCTDKKIVFIFPSLQLRNHGSHKLEFSPTSGLTIIKDTDVVVFSKPKGITLSCNAPNKCDNVINCDCEATSGNPKSTFTWNLENNGQQKSLTSGAQTGSYEKFEKGTSSLEYTLLLGDKGGEMNCLMNNDHGTIKASYAVDFKFPPEILLSLDSPSTWNEFDSLLIDCNVTGSPIPETYWRNPNGTHLLGPILNITSLAVDDQGNYTCVTSNCLGDSNLEIQILVEPRKLIESTQSPEEPLSPGAIAGIVVACVVVVGVTVGLLVYFLKFRVVAPVNPQ